MRPIRDDSGERNGWWIGERFVPDDGSDLMRRDSEIAKLKLMVRDLYLWFNVALDDELTDEGREALCAEIPNDRWREIKAVVGQAADEEKP